jgi:ABC-type Na+ efflux pump permease subunit
MVIASGRKAAEAATTQAASAPAATDTQPASTTPADKKPAADPKAVAAQRMGNLLLLFSLMSFGVTIAGVAWVIYDVRRSRPAWMTQTRYPAHQRRK